MIRLFTVLFFAIIVQASAQTSVPKSINYQGIARDAAGDPITSSFDIQFIIKDAATIVHNEVQTGIQPNALGLFSTLIGKPPNTLTLSLPGLNNGPFTLDVLIKTGSSFTLVGTQPFVSVPFALLAGHVASSYTNNILTIGANSYSLNTGSSITPTIIGTGLASVTPTIGPLYTVNVPPATLGYASAGNILTLMQGASVSTVALTGSGSSTITMLGQGNAVVTPTFGSAFTINVPPQVLSNTSNTINLSNGGGNIVVPSLTLSGGTGINILGTWPSQTLTVPGATNVPWVKAASSVTLAVNSDLVGVGVNLPNAKLDVSGSPTANISIIKATNPNAASTFPVIDVSTNGTSGMMINELSSSGGIAGNFNSNLGTAVYASSNGTAHAVQATSNGSIVSTYAGFFEGGVYTKGKTSNNTGNALIAQNSALTNLMVVRNDGNVGIGTTNPTDRLDVIGKTSTDSIQITSPIAPTAGAILLSRDNLGNTKWSSGQIAFQFYFAPTAAITLTTNTVNNLGNNIQFSGSSSVAIGSGFNATNAQFTAPVTGLYDFSASLEVALNSSAVGNNWIYLEICKNPGTPVILKRSLMNNQDATLPTYCVLQANTLAVLNAGEVVFLRAVGNSGGTGGSITTNNQPNFINSFSGHLIR